MTPEHRMARLGKLTASRAGVLMGGLETQGLADLVKECAFARVYGDEEEEGYQSKHMERGTLMEPLAKAWYQFETELELTANGEFVVHPDFPYVGAAPDAQTADRVVEAKCPGAKAWMETKRTGLVPATYRWQCRWQQWTCSKRLCDFVAWHKLSGGLIVPIAVTDSEIDQMAERAALVETMVQKWIDILQDRKA